MSFALRQAFQQWPDGMWCSLTEEVYIVVCYLVKIKISRPAQRAMLSQEVQVTHRDLLPQTCSLLQRAELSKLNTAEEEGMWVELVRNEVSVCITETGLFKFVQYQIVSSATDSATQRHLTFFFYPCQNYSYLNATPCSSKLQIKLKNWQATQCCSFSNFFFASEGSSCLFVPACTLFLKLY